MCWLESYAEKHEFCSEKVKPEGWLPTRLIDGGVSSDFRDVRLCLASEIPKGSRYLALSHSWGSSQSLRPRRSNFDELGKETPYHDGLSLNFKDAIYVTRQCSSSHGIRHVWIDSLCIIQDEEDQDDWKSEASRMGHVYRNAFLTISAIDMDGNSGICLDTYQNALGHLVLTKLPWEKQIDPG